ncbi:MFS transporter [Aspergillus ruber CBS 135680]|uniref:MFS general substrate transporter n=1 Tax=Aspergillus ruber (strain CBS 135680) TaxID=1388766 RepID=A0A017STW8_ASPRC|nr:MFS general substrate transporter [Aspergillus ruber CBS 135680]EYE99745.1 MFS general substrate transporter [Aspergillus ruber CBS 135680]
MDDNPRISQSSDSNIGTASPKTETTMTLENNANVNHETNNNKEYGILSTTEDASHQDIEHLYLDFETPLPNPMGISSPRSGQSPPPSPPNLNKYTSPFLWSKPRKTIITIISCCVTALSAYAAGEYTPPSEELTAKWHVSKVAYNVGITLFTLGFGIAPMVLAPFSEINGRRPIFVASGLVFTVCLIGCGATDSYAGMLVGRFFLGIGGSTFSTMVGGVISDIYHAQDRNGPMSCFSGAALFGTGLGPLISGFIEMRVSWRWIFYSEAIASAIFLVLLLAFLKETRGSVLLSGKAKALNKYYDKLEEAGYYGVVFTAEDSGEKQRVQRIRWKVKSDEERETLVRMVTISCYRPFHLLFTEPVVFFFSLWVAFSWAILYLNFSSIPLVFSTNHGFNVEQIGAVFSAVSIGALLATLLSIYQEKLAMRLGKMPNTPEGRLYFTCVESILMPIGLFWFGWTSYSSVPWIVPTLALGCATMGIFSIYLATFNYLADTYHRYASSAIAAQSFCRNILAGIFPLVANFMFTNLTYPGASSLLGGIV